ncbi:MAG: YTH domain-containing protein 2 [Pycnora praestabilis]|nr:MAG: YTH domain-containing protein 2 [Pycnora praestabilis]
MTTPTEKCSNPNTFTGMESVDTSPHVGQLCPSEHQNSSDADTASKDSDYGGIILSPSRNPSSPALRYKICLHKPHESFNTLAPGFFLPSSLENPNIDPIEDDLKLLGSLQALQTDNQISSRIPVVLDFGPSTPHRSMNRDSSTPLSSSFVEQAQWWTSIPNEQIPWPNDPDQHLPSRPHLKLRLTASDIKPKNDWEEFLQARMRANEASKRDSPRTPSHFRSGNFDSSQGSGEGDHSSLHSPYTPSRRAFGSIPSMPPVRTYNTFPGPRTPGRSPLTGHSPISLGKKSQLDGMNEGKPLHNQSKLCSNQKAPIYKRRSAQLCMQLSTQQVNALRLRPRARSESTQHDSVTNIPVPRRTVWRATTFADENKTYSVPHVPPQSDPFRAGSSTCTTGNLHFENVHANSPNQGSSYQTLDQGNQMAKPVGEMPSGYPHAGAPVWQLGEDFAPSSIPTNIKMPSNEHQGGTYHEKRHLLISSSGKSTGAIDHTYCTGLQCRANRGLSKQYHLILFDSMKKQRAEWLGSGLSDDEWARFNERFFLRKASGATLVPSIQSSIACNGSTISEGGFSDRALIAFPKYLKTMIPDSASAPPSGNYALPSYLQDQQEYEQGYRFQHQKGYHATHLVSIQQPHNSQYTHPPNTFRDDQNRAASRRSLGISYIDQEMFTATDLRSRSRTLLVPEKNEPPAWIQRREVNSVDSRIARGEALWSSSPIAMKLLARLNPDAYVLPYRSVVFRVKSTIEANVRASIQYSLWSSTPKGNLEFEKAWQARKHHNDHIILVFSINSRQVTLIYARSFNKLAANALRSHKYCGLAEMSGPVDFNLRPPIWVGENFSGAFSVQWIYCKDAYFSEFPSILNPRNDNKPMTLLRDATILPMEAGRRLVEIYVQAPHIHNVFLIDQQQPVASSMAQLRYSSRYIRSPFELPAEGLYNQRQASTGIVADVARMDDSHSSQHSRLLKRPRIVGATNNLIMTSDAYTDFGPTDPGAVPHYQWYATPSIQTPAGLTRFYPYMPLDQALIERLPAAIYHKLSGFPSQSTPAHYAGPGRIPGATNCRQVPGRASTVLYNYTAPQSQGESERPGCAPDSQRSILG